MSLMSLDGLGYVKRHSNSKKQSQQFLKDAAVLPDQHQGASTHGAAEDDDDVVEEAPEEDAEREGLADLDVDLSQFDFEEASDGDDDDDGN